MLPRSPTGPQDADCFLSVEPIVPRVEVFCCARRQKTGVTMQPLRNSAHIADGTFILREEQFD